MTPKEVLDMAKENGAVVVDLRFMDFPGLWQHFTVPISELEESSFEDGFGFDGSSIRGWQPIHASDMLVVPDATTAKMDPFYEAPTLVLICKTWPTSGRKLNFLSLMISGLNPPAFLLFMRSIPSKATGTRAGTKAPIWATSRATKKAISRFHPWTNSRTCAPRWF
jgi:hypothetical protein